MKGSKKKPTKWEWYLPVPFLAVGIILLFTPWRDRAPYLISAGVGFLWGLNARRRSYLNLPEADQKRADREDRDERNLMLRDRTSWLCWQGESVLLGAGLFLITITAEEIEWPVFLLVCSILLVRELIYLAVHRRLAKKY